MEKEEKSDNTQESPDKYILNFSSKDFLALWLKTIPTWESGVLEINHLGLTNCLFDIDTEEGENVVDVE